LTTGQLLAGPNALWHIKPKFRVSHGRMWAMNAIMGALQRGLTHAAAPHDKIHFSIFRCPRMQNMKEFIIKMLIALWHACRLPASSTVDWVLTN